MTKEFITNINNNIIFAGIGIFMLFWSGLNFIVSLLLSKNSFTKNKFIELMANSVKKISVIIGFILPIVFIVISFMYWNGLKFWIAQGVSWLTLINFFVFSKMFKQLQGMPSLEDLKKK
ncbi:MAG: hypothetical protein L3J35_03620 [Bacteroidales bacterium]|nr:hypothetical protein [Bacteroidales bacterium]